MSGIFQIIGLLLVCLGTFSWAAEDSWYNRYVNFYNNTVPNSPRLRRLWQNHLNSFNNHNTISKRATRQRYPVPPFNCHKEFPGDSSRRPATSVHKLQPSDISVVAAMGDSLTAGNGVDAKNLAQVAVQYRGLSWSVGGDDSLDEGVLTLPNILKKYNPRLFGYSTGTGFSWLRNSRLNVAGAGDTSL